MLCHFTSVKFCLVLLNIKTNFELWKVAKPGTLKYEKSICIKTFGNKNKSKSWKQINNNIILEWQSKWKHATSVKNCWFLHTAKNLVHFPVIDYFQCKINQIIWIANNFQETQRKGVFFQGVNCLPCVYIVYLVFITVNLVKLWSWSVWCSCSSWCLLTIIIEF